MAWPVYWASMPSFSICEGLGAQLGDPGLGDPEEAGQLLGGAVLEEVADDHQALALGQQADGVAQVGVQLAGLELLERLDGAAVARARRRG